MAIAVAVAQPPAAATATVAAIAVAIVTSAGMVSDGSQVTGRWSMPIRHKDDGDVRDPRRCVMDVCLGACEKRFQRTDC